MRPEHAEFGVTIDFIRGRSDPVQVFAAMTDLLAGFAGMDRALIGAIAPGAEPVTVIEDVEAASITAWIKSRLEKVEDDALKSLDWKKQVGVYLVKAKYRVIEFLDDRLKAEKQERLKQLRNDLGELAQEVAPAMFAPEIDPSLLLEAMNKVQAAKGMLTHGERVTIRSDDAGDHAVDITSNDPIEIEVLEAPPDSIGGGDTEMILLIKKADMLGKSQWEFKHGSSSFRAKIADEDWLERFHRGQERIASGARMRATVTETYSYTAAGDLIAGDHEVKTVHEIILPTDGIQVRLDV